jgi:hypothetical protein
MAKIVPDPADSPKGSEEEAEAAEAAKAAKEEAEEDDGNGNGQERELTDPPVVTVLGHMDGSVALRLGWKHGLHIVSNSRFRFMKEDLSMDVTDNKEDYLF